MINSGAFCWSFAKKHSLTIWDKVNKLPRVGLGKEAVLNEKLNQISDLIC